MKKVKLKEKLPVEAPVVEAAQPSVPQERPSELLGKLATANKLSIIRFELRKIERRVLNFIQLQNGETKLLSDEELQKELDAAKK